jgi:hypothetical protein
MNPKKEQGASWEDLSRPADVLADWSLGKKAAFDISVVSPLTENNLLLSAGAKDVVEDQANTKHMENDPQCAHFGWICVPLIVDSYYDGRWCHEAHSAFSKIADNLHIKLKGSFADALSFIYCSLGLVLSCPAKRFFYSCSSSSSPGWFA